MEVQEPTIIEKEEDHEEDKCFAYLVDQIALLMMDDDDDKAKLEEVKVQ